MDTKIGIYICCFGSHSLTVKQVYKNINAYQQLKENFLNDCLLYETKHYN